MKFSIFSYLTDWVSNSKLLNLTDELMISDFSAHIAWSIVVSIGIDHLFGHTVTYIACIFWLVDWFVWKMLDRGHLKLIIEGKEDGNTVHNLIVNFFSNMTIPAFYCIWTILSS